MLNVDSEPNDKMKGIAVDYSYEIRETSGDFTIVSTERLTNTNSDVWSVTPTASVTPVPEFPLFVVPLLLIVATSMLLVAIKKRKSSSAFPY